VTTSAASSADNRIERLLWPSADGTLALVLLIGIPRKWQKWLAMLGLLVLFA
jgi:hypothetical protein